MPKILESEALALAQNIDTLSDAEKPLALDILKRYQAQQWDNGEPEWPTQARSQKEGDARFRSMFEDLKNVDKAAPSLADALQYSDNPDADRARVASIAYLSRVSGKPADEIGSSLDLYRNDYTTRRGQKGTDDLGFYKLAAAEVAAMKRKEDTALEGAKAALRGEDVIASLQAWQAKNLDRIPDSTEFTKGYLKAKEEAGDYLPIADELLKLMESGTGKSTRPFDSAAANRLDEIAGELATMKPRERKQVYASISARAEAAGYEQKGFWSQMLGELDKGLYRMSSTLGTQAGIASDLASNIPALLAEGMTGNRDFGMTPSEVANTDASIAKRQALGEMQSELAAIVAGEIDPVRPTLGWLNDTIETGFIKGPGAVAPFVGASAVLGPWGSGLLFTADFAEQNRRDLRAMGMDNDKAMEIGVIAAPLQAAVESLSNMVQLGGFTKLQTVLAGFTKPIGGGAGLAVRYVQNAVISLATEFTEEQLQDNFIVPAVQEIVGALAEDVPEVDWSFFKTRAAESTPELLSVLAPMALVFGGVMTNAQANLSRDMTGNIDALKALNYSEAQAVEVVSEKTEDARIAKARSLWASRAGDKITLESGAKNLAERMRQLSGDAMAQQRELERRGKLPILRPMADGKWLMTIPSDGSAATFDSHQEADKARWTWTEDQLGKVHALTRETLASMEKNLNVGREVAVEVFPDIRTAQDAVNEGASVEQIKNRVEQGKVLGDISPDTSFEDAQAIDKATTEADGFLSSLRILGSSKNEFKDGILRTTIKLWEGANILTLVEEKLEGDAKAIIMEPKGREWMLSRLRNYEQASGDKLFRELPDEQLKNEDLVEAWSHLGQSYLVGRSTFGEPLQKKAMRRFGRLLMRSGLTGAMNAESSFFAAVASRAQKLSELKQAGKLSDDLVSELEKQLGIDSQVAHDAAATKEADAIASEAVDTSGYSPETPGPNGETFSVQQLAADFEQKGKFYRVIHGEAAFQDVVESGFVRTNASAKVDLGSSLMERLKARPTAFPSFSKDHAAMSYAQSNPNHFIIVTEDASLQPSTSGRHSKGKTYFPTNEQGEHLSSLPADKVDIFRHVGDGIYQLAFTRGKVTSEENPGPNGETFSTRAVPADASKIVQMPDGAQFVGPTTFSIRAYHGTPHKVDRFRTDKIGTGEGAQAYGWGLYFAENRGIGEYYQRALTDNTLYFKGRPLLKNGIMVGSLGDVELDDWFYHGSESFDPEESAQSAEADGRPDIAAKIRSLIPDITKGEPGNLYTVELLPDESEFLDWDKPLSEQSEKVKAAFAQLYKDNKSAFDYYDKTQSSKFSDGSIYGSALYARISMRDMPAGNDAQASKILASMGVKGIKYLDAGSRGAGDGTRNFVIFDENLVRILEENGKPVETFSMASTSGAAQNAEPSPGGLSEAEVPILFGEDNRLTNLNPQGASWSRIKSENPGVQPGQSTVSVYRATIGKTIRRGDFVALNPKIAREHLQALKERGDKGARVITQEVALKDLLMANDATEFVFAPESSRAATDTFSIRPGDFSARMEAKFSLFQAKPELRLAIAQVAKERALRLGAEVIAKGDVIRSAKDIGKEARMREALAYEARMNEYLDGLSENARQTLEFEPSALEDDPLVSAMLDEGKLMSRSTAVKNGVKNLDEYDGVPWLPPAWYSKGAGITPGKMAKALHEGPRGEGGPLSAGDSAQDLWDSLAEVIASTRKDKAAHREAVQAYKAAEKYARDASRAEADQWAENAKKQAGSPKAQRDMLKAALRTLDGILAAAPPEVRARVGGYVKLAGLATDEAMLQEIERRIDKLNVELEKWLKKELRAKIEKQVDRYKSKKKDGASRGKLDAESTALFDYASSLISKTAEEQEREVSGLESAISSEEDASKLSAILERYGVASLFVNYEEQTSAQLDAIAAWADDVIDGGRARRKALNEARMKEMEEDRKLVRDGALPGIPASRAAAMALEKVALESGMWRKAWKSIRSIWDHFLLTLPQQLGDILGEGNAFTEKTLFRVMDAHNAKEDLLMQLSNERRALLRDVFKTKSDITIAKRLAGLQVVKKHSGVFKEHGRKSETVKVPREKVEAFIEDRLAAETFGLNEDAVSDLAEQWAEDQEKDNYAVKVEQAGAVAEMPLSEMEALQFLFSWNQEDIRASMERDGWTEENAAQLRKLISPEANEIGKWMLSWYAKAYDIINPVHQRLYFAPMARNPMYAPIVRDVSKAAEIMPLDDMGASGMASGFTKNRVKTNTRLKKADAMLVFLTHFEQVSHWVNYAELVRDLKSVLLHESVRDSITAAGGTRPMSLIKERIAAIENAGGDAAQSMAAVSGLWSRFNQARAFRALSFRLSPVFKQQSAILNPLLGDVAADDYVRGMADVLEGKVDLKELWNSPIIQRRLTMGFSPEMRITMNEAAQGMPISAAVLTLGQKGMLPMQYMDAFWNTVGHGAAFSAFRRDFSKAGANPELATKLAVQEVEKSIYTTSQPNALENRALIENSRNPFVKSIWMFGSENRKTLAIEYMALKRLFTGKSKNKKRDIQRVLVAHVGMAVVNQAMVVALSMLIGDDDDKEGATSQDAWLAALVLGPISGLFAFGQIVEMGIKRAFDLRTYLNQTPFQEAANEIVRVGTNLDDLFEDDDDLMKNIDSLASAVAKAALLVTPAAGAVDAVGNIPRQAADIAKNASD